MNRKIRVLIVDDSASVRQTLSDILVSDPEIELLRVLASAAMSRMRSISESLKSRMEKRLVILLSFILAHLEALQTPWDRKSARKREVLLTRISDRRILKPRCN